ncbi:MAG: hypothetical protein V3R86_02475 [Candidatus Hydrothermarchaeaceae archaeon]
MPLFCLSFHHIKTSYSNFLKARFDDPKEFYNLTSGERVLVQTETRIEVYAFKNDVKSLFDRFISKSGLSRSEIEEFFKVYRGNEAVVHLLRMTGCIESRVLGETYIPLAVKAAYQTAEDCDAVGPKIKTLFDSANRVGERAHLETKINNSKKVVDIATSLILSELPKAFEKSVVLLGAGTSGRKVAEILARHNCKILAVSRSLETGRIAGREVGCDVLEYHRLNEAIFHADVLICATLASHYRVLPRMILPRTKPLTIVDLSPFRNVSPKVASIQKVILKNGKIDEAIEKSHKSAKREVYKVEQIIKEEI